MGATFSTAGFFRISSTIETGKNCARAGETSRSAPASLLSRAAAACSSAATLTIRVAKTSATPRAMAKAVKSVRPVRARRLRRVRRSMGELPNPKLKIPTRTRLNCAKPQGPIYWTKYIVIADYLRLPTGALLELRRMALDNFQRAGDAILGADLFAKCGGADA